MRFINKRTLAGLAATAAAVGICLTGMTGPAGATGTDYTVSPAGNTSVTGTNSGNLVFQDTAAAAAKMTCTSGTGNGVAYGGGHTYVPATPVAPYTGYDAAADLTSFSLSGCTNQVVGPVTVTPSTLPWHLACTATTATGCTGYLYGVSAHLVASTCSLTGTGVIYGSYTNATSSFTGSTTPGLTVSAVSGPLCAAVPVKNGDVAYLSGTVVISPAVSVS